MVSELILYPFLFITIFFESFLLIVFLSTPARKSRERLLSTKTPQVAVIVPCWNEESTIERTIASLLALEYPQEKLSIILVDDGSTDNTYAVMQRFAHNPQVHILQQENGGKYTAVNAGIEKARGAEFIGCLDADSFVDKGALREIISCFEDAEVMAATASMSVHQPQTVMQRIQYVEYLLGISMRHIFSVVNSIYVTPGPFSFYRPEVFEKIGAFRHGHLTEDMEMALRMQRAGYRIENAIRARVYTKAPATFGKLFKQRVRWITGFLRNVLYDYRDLIGNQRHGALGLIILPISLISIVFAIFIFVSIVIQIVKNSLGVLSIIGEVPLTYIFTHYPLHWLYAPYSVSIVLGVVLMSIVLLLVTVGKRASQTPGALLPNVLLYVGLYTFLSPLWLMRSVADVTRGAKNTWR